MAKTAGQVSSQQGRNFANQSLLHSYACRQHSRSRLIEGRWARLRHHDVPIGRLIGRIRQDWIRSDQIGLDSIRQDQIGLERIRKDQIGLDRIRQDQVGLDRIRQDQIGLDRIRQDQIRLDQIRLDQIRLDQIDRQIGRQIDRQTGLDKIDRQKDRQIDRIRQDQIGLDTCN